MDATNAKRRLRAGLLGLALVGLCVAQCGCLLALAGAGAGAGAYAYSKGQTKAYFCSDFSTTWHATRNGLGSLGLPITDERYAGLQGTIEARTGDGKRVVIKLKSAAAPIPTDGFRTEVAVRVGTFGDQAIGDRILTEIGMRLHPPGRDVILAPPTTARPPAAPAPNAGPAERIPTMPAPVAPPPRPTEPGEVLPPP